MIQFLGEVREWQGAEKNKPQNLPSLWLFLSFIPVHQLKKFVFLQPRALSIVGPILQFSLSIEIVHTRVRRYYKSRRVRQSFI